MLPAGGIDFAAANQFTWPPANGWVAQLDATDMVLPHDIFLSGLAGAVAIALIVAGAEGWRLWGLALVAAASLGTMADLMYHGWMH